MDKIFILIPIKDDWGALNILLSKISKYLIFSKKINILILDDCSKKIDINHNLIKKFENITVVSLKKNHGSQRCIAIGIDFLIKKYLRFKLIIMDGDGEDNPFLIKNMLQLSKIYPEEAILIYRTSRKENLVLKLLYELYIILNFILTFKLIRFGNFSLINRYHAEKMCKNNYLWFAYPPAIFKSSIKFKKIFASKEKRYLGDSKMNYYKLFQHWLRILLPFKKRVFFIALFYLFIFIFIQEKINLISFFFIVTYFFLVALTLSLDKKIRASKPKKLKDTIKRVKILKY